MNNLEQLTTEEKQLQQRLAEIESLKQQEKRRSQLEYESQLQSDIRTRSEDEWKQLLEVAEKINKASDEIQEGLLRLKSFKAMHNNYSQYRLFLQGGLQQTHLPRVRITNNSANLAIEPGKL